MSEIYTELFLEQSPAYHPNIKQMNTDFDLPKSDRDELRRLAEQVAEIAARDDMKVKRKLWTDQNALRTDTPVVFADPEVGWNEIQPADTFVCRHPLARVWENTLRKQIFSGNVIKDDKVIEAYIDVPYSYEDDGWGFEIKRTGDDIIAGGGAYHIEAVLEDYERDLEKLRVPNITIDWRQSNKIMQLAEHVFGGILSVRRRMFWHWDVSCVERFVALRGMDNLMLDFVLEQDNLHRAMRIITDGMQKRLDWMEEEHLLNLNNDSHYVGTGGQGWSDELPAADFGGKVRTKDMWGAVQAQETVSVDPKAYGEIILPYQIELMKRFGLCHYGCCEPTDIRWEQVKKLPNLRRVSWSPWADPAKVPEMLGKNYVALIKPSPTPLATAVMDEDVVRKYARRCVEGSKGGICEFIMKDNHTLGGEGQRIVRWVEIMREEIDRVYG